MSQDEDKALDAAWRRASAAEAGPPPAKLRAAILAEAAAAARRRQPAANQPRYWMRVVAGLAVVGVGVMLWRQTEVRLPGEPPVVTVPVTERDVAMQADAGAAAESARESVPVAPEAQREPPAPVEPERSSQAFSRAEERKAAPADRSPPVVEQSAPPAVAPTPVSPPAVSPPSPPPPVTQAAGDSREAPGAVADEGSSLEEVQVTGTRILRERAVGPRAAPGATVPVRPPAPAAAELLRLHFPAQLASAQPHRLWVVLDATNRVVLTGELAPGQQLQSLTEQVRRETGAAPGNWRVEQVSNAQGQIIEMAISRLPR